MRINSGETRIDSTINSGNTRISSGNTRIDAGNTTMDPGNTRISSGNKAIDSGKTTMISKKTTIDTGNTTMDSGSTRINSGKTLQELTGYYCFIKMKRKCYTQKVFCYRYMYLDNRSGKIMDAYLQQIRWRKQINHSQEWVWERRRAGATLGQNFGPEWGPEV